MFYVIAALFVGVGIMLLLAHRRPKSAPGSQPQQASAPEPAASPRRAEPVQASPAPQHAETAKAAVQPQPATTRETEPAQEARPPTSPKPPKEPRRRKAAPKHRRARNQPEPERITKEEYLRQLAERSGGLHPYDEEPSEWQSR